MPSLGSSPLPTRMQVIPSTYTLVSGTGSDSNASFNISGGNLRTSAVFDFATPRTATLSACAQPTREGCIRRRCSRLRCCFLH